MTKTNLIKKLRHLSASDLHSSIIDIEKYDMVFGQFFLETVEKIASTSGIDVLSLNGDTLDRPLEYGNASIQYLHNMLSLLEKMAEVYNFVIIILRGTLSHDGNQLNSLRFLENSGRVKIVDKVTEYITVKDFLIRCIPEPYFATYEDFMNTALDRVADITIFHGTISGINAIAEKNMRSNITGRVRDIVIERDELERLTTLYCTGGHFHGRCALSPKTWYTGSPFAWSYNDIGYDNKGIDYIISNVYSNENGSMNYEFEINFFKNEESEVFTKTDITSMIQNRNLDEIKAYLYLIKRNLRYKQNMRLDIDLQFITPENMHKVSEVKQIFNNQFDFKIETTKKTSQIELDSINRNSEFILDTSIPITEKIYKEIQDDKMIPETMKERLTLDRIEYFTNDYIGSEEI